MNNPNSSFRRLSGITSVLFFVLTLVWMFFPEKALTGWGVEYTEAAGLVSRRAASIYAGLCVMFWLVRNSPPSPARYAMSSGIITACLIIAIDGLMDFYTGRANSGILVAVFIEIALAISHIKMGISFRRR
ncbi:TPA: hypothetical protein I8370_001786 [Klebsiella oxytoca]|nr:hypothetical protein [Klebsiella oxytoca]